MSSEEFDGGAQVQFGLLNILRTGNPMVDMGIAVMLPIIFKVLISVFYSGHPYLRQAYEFLFAERYFSRSIRFETIMGKGGVRPSEATGTGEKRNSLLQKAISLYLGHVLSDSESKLRSADTNLMAVKEKYAVNRETWRAEYGTTISALNSYSLVMAPALGRWTELEAELDFRILVDVERGRYEHDPTKTTTIFTFRSSRKDGSKHIKSFLNRAFDWYKRELAESCDTNTKYMYMFQKQRNLDPREEEDSTVCRPTKCRRYKLSNRKTFSSLFFPEKQSLLSTLESFSKKTGRYAVPGYPHKLGLLLHGPPGTGKTSLIKALAAYTNRNIVSIPLARIKTNQDLMNIMFDLKFDVDGEDVPIELAFKDTIFVMEDVDCASKVVHQRRSSLSENPAEDDEYSQEPEESGQNAVVAALVSNLTSGDKKNPTLDKLNLQGLLECLDGVIDTEDRMVIMTTNHPEKLDPALIRPGRIDKIIELGYIKPAQVIELVEHYFGCCKSEKEIYSIFSNGEKRITPAQIEQMAAECACEVDLVNKIAIK